jgi:predicted dinucleotide-binding enzyme
MKVAVIGAGGFGSVFAKAAVAAGHDVSVSARHQDHAEKVAADTGATARAEGDAAGWADVVVLAIPGIAAKDWAGDAAGRLAGKVVIDATNPINGDMSDLVTVGTSNAEELQKQLPDARVVKAFNTILASRVNAPQQDGARLDALLAGDDAAAKQTVSQLADSLGFTPRDAGRLRMARALEEIAFLNIGLNGANGWVWQSAFQLVGPTTA